MKITVIIGNGANNFELRGEAFTLRLNPTNEQAYNYASRQGFALLIELIGKDAAQKVYQNTLPVVTLDDSYWTRRGKWAGKKFRYTARVAR
jgi:hypothetical protein